MPCLKETLDEVERKRAAWEIAERGEKLVREVLRANLFVGAYFAPKTRGNHRQGSPNPRPEPSRQRATTTLRS